MNDILRPNKIEWDIPFIYNIYSVLKGTYKILVKEK